MIKLPEWIKKSDISHTQETTNNGGANRLEKSQYYLNEIWQRIINWKNYPKDYFNLYESQGKITLCHYKNNLLVRNQEVSLNDTEWHEYIYQNSSLPIHLVLQGQDCEFRSFPTKQINIWDRFFLFNQLKINEFHPNDLIEHYQPKQSFEKVDILIAIRSSDFLRKIYETLESFKNPIGGVISWDIEQSLAMKKQASITRALQQWVVTLIPIENHKFTMLVLRQDAILLQRVVHSKTTKDIEKELRSTLRFLQRQGYTEGQHVSILVHEDIIEITEFSHEEFEVVAVSKRLLENESYKPRKSFLKFIPEVLKQANLAYHLPRLSIKFLLPISMILLILWATIQIKSFFQDYESKWINSNFEEISKKTLGNFSEQVHFSKMFANYVSTANNNPSSLIANVNKLLKGKFQVLSITWSQNAQGNELRLNFPAVVKGKKPKFKKYINQNSERVLGDSTIAWSEQDNETVLLIQQHTAKMVNKNDN